AHVVLEEAPRAPAPRAAPAGGARLFPISARSDAALRDVAARYAAHLAAHPGTDLAAVAATLQAGLAHLLHRAAVVADTVADLREKLEAIAAGKPGPEVA